MRRALTNLVDNAIASVRGDGEPGGKAGHVLVRTAHEPTAMPVLIAATPNTI